MDEASDSGSEGEILKASGPGPGQVDVGMEVTSLDGEHVGKVKEVGAGEFLVDRPLAREGFRSSAADVDKSRLAACFS